MPTVLYVLFALCFFPYLMAGTAAVLRARQFGRFDNNHPRLQQAEMRGLGARANGAQGNSWEALTVFAAAVLIAHANNLPLERLDNVAVIFLLVRLVYLGLYLADWAWARTAAFITGLACCVYIFYLAATYGAGGI